LTGGWGVGGSKYGPALMDFGTVDYKASSQRTFSITAPTAGAVTLQMPKGMFLATELRRIAPAQVGRGSSAQALRPAPAKPIPVQADNFFSIYQLNFAAGEEMQLDIVFTPGNLNDASPGPRTGTMVLSGPGNQPWRVSIPLRGAVAGSLVQLNPQTGPSAKAPKPAVTTPSSAAPATVSALPTPAPGPKGAAVAMNTPTHSPDQFDFCEVWNDDMTRKNFHLTTTAAGYVTVQIPKGPFRVAEFRELGPVQLPSKNNPGNKSTKTSDPYHRSRTRSLIRMGSRDHFSGVWRRTPISRSTSPSSPTSTSSPKRQGRSQRP